MKNLVAVVVMLVLSETMSAANSDEFNTGVRIVAVKSHSIYFKVDQTLVGGKVEVYDSNQKLLGTEELPQSYSMVCFDQKPSGTYYIKIKKGSKAVEFGYVHI